MNRRELLIGTAAAGAATLLPAPAEAVTGTDFWISENGMFCFEQSIFDGFRFVGTMTYTYRASLLEMFCEELSSNTPTDGGSADPAAPSASAAPGIRPGLLES